jgi:hypothetical protein
MVNLAKLRSYRTAPRYKYGYEVPRDYNHAVELDTRNGNTKWQDSTKLEMAQLDEYETFKDLGSGVKPPDGHKKIRVHLVFDVKHDGHHKVALLWMATLQMSQSKVFTLVLSPFEVSDSSFS